MSIALEHLASELSRKFALLDAYTVEREGLQAELSTTRQNLAALAVRRADFDEQTAWHTAERDFLQAEVTRLGARILVVEAPNERHIKIALALALNEMRDDVERLKREMEVMKGLHEELWEERKALQEHVLADETRSAKMKATMKW